MKSYIFSDLEIEKEAERLYQKLKYNGYSKSLCKVYASLTLEINRLKEERNALILAHTYMTPDIIFGVADFVGDSLKLSQEARNTNKDVIVFAGVIFMAETAKILNKEKRVFIVSKDAGCSLADSIKASDVIKLRKKFPKLKVITYINTTAEVKAESDIICTSSNAKDIIEYLPDREFIFLPDKLMAKNLEDLTGKRLISWDGTCIVHEEFNENSIHEWKRLHPDLKVLSHIECNSQVVKSSDYSGSTEGIRNYVLNSKDKKFMIVTECGMADRLRIEFPEKEFYGSCVLCPYMKKNSLAGIYEVLKELPMDKEIILSEEVIESAYLPLKRMFELTEEIRKLKAYGKGK
ncbi:MAG: quinolinate synthase NadA [Candidatus Micrarchaeota archaeon]|nr:quinolinate synthase NadA [Candidatus Micrarchaeota archaeon]